MALRAKGGHITPTMNTLQIQRDNGHIADPEALDSLRNVYLPVRYGGYRPTLQDQKLARAAVERIRRSEVTAEAGIEREDK
jgi:hypothetical protein